MATYTVKKGDTLSEIAAAYKSQYGYSSTYVYMNTLVELNNIKNPDVIVVGQVIKLDGEATATTPNATSKPVIDVFGIQSNTDRTAYITWTWDKDNTEHYQVKWYYDTGDSVWFVGNDSTTKEKQSLYTAPSNAIKIKVQVKPVSETHTVNNKETSYWTASWSTAKTHTFADLPETPSTPTVEIEDFKLTVTLDNIDEDTTSIEFQIVKDDSSLFKTGSCSVSYAHVSYSCTITAGASYKVRCRAKKGSLYSEWSQYSNNVGTIPSTPSSITKCAATSRTSIRIEWEEVANATSYDIEYATKAEYFDGSDSTTTVSNIEFTHYEKTGLTSGEEYFFRVRAVNDKGHSGWSGIKSVVIGKPPAAPTTWSSTTTATTGDILTLYWVHNAEDDSRQTYAEIEVDINGDVDVRTVQTPSTDEDDTNKTSSYVLLTDGWTEGMVIKWRVRTSGITNEYGDWSIQRSIDVYAPPTLELSVTDTSGNDLNILESFPIYISGVTGPSTQSPISYYLTVKANESYETVDNFGNSKNVNRGDEVYAKHFDISSPLDTTISASDVSLENNVEYTINCLVAMNSGLTVESSVIFTVAWTEEEVEPNAEISVDEVTYTASIKPYCKDGYNELVPGVTLSVYRREFDGTFTELGTGLANDDSTFVTDPHPSLDFARYRIVARTDSTGTVSYYDVPGYPVGCKAIVIQWDEDWSTFDTSEEAELAEQPWTGSMLVLPYNIDTSEGNSSDIALVEYIGRKYPVSYYGTQLGISATWNTVIPADDKDTLYALRRLQIWMGDVYVREPSGTGYWANISVSFSQKHLDTIIPVTINLTRVSGGM